MHRLFLDANVLFSAAYKSGARVFDLWKLKDAVLCSSRYALEEARANLSDSDQQKRLANLAETLNLFDTADRKLPHGISLPEKDVPILLAAIEARATYLLTGDLRHFGPYLGKKVERAFVVLTPAQYFKVREREQR